MSKVEMFEYKLAGMRKPDSFIVYPRQKDGDTGTIIAQGHRTICEFNQTTGKGRINWRGSGHKGFIHLNLVLGAEPFTFPKEFVGLCVEFRPSSGDLIGASPETGPVYLA